MTIIIGVSMIFVGILWLLAALYAWKNDTGLWGFCANTLPMAYALMLVGIGIAGVGTIQWVAAHVSIH